MVAVVAIPIARPWPFEEVAAEEHNENIGGLCQAAGCQFVKPVPSFSSARSTEPSFSLCVAPEAGHISEVIALDARTKERSPSAEKPRLPATKPEQLQPPKDRQANSATQETEKPSPSLPDRLREHWLLASVATCLLLVAVIGGVVYWLGVRDYESIDDAF